MKRGLGIIESWKLFLLILKRTHGDVLLYSFLVFFFFSALLLWALDPGVGSLGDAIWLAFNISTSIGLGDFTVTTLPARLVAVLLGVYGAVVVTYIPGMIVSYYTEQAASRQDQSIEQYYDDLMNVNAMSQDQKASLSRKIAQTKERPLS